MKAFVKIFSYGLLITSLIALQAVNGAIFTVTNTGDNGGIDPLPGAGTGTLRQAIVDANNNTGPDQIVFQISPGGLQTIQPLRQLPDLNDPAGVFIDGFSQPGGAAPGINPPSTAVLLIEIDGSQCLPYGNTSHGFVLRSPNNHIQGLIINNFRNDGILIPVMASGIYNNMVFCNFIGTDPSGTIPQGNGWDQTQLWAGVYIGSLGNGATFQNHVVCNLISSNFAEGVGIMSCPPHVDVHSNIVANNYIGTDITGMVAMGNAHVGVYIGEGARNNVVDGNLISANGYEGVCIIGYPPYGWDSHSNIISNNIIGLTIGLTPLGNLSDGVGIGIYGANQSPQHYPGGFSTNNTIGPNNIIAHNGRNGVMVWEYYDGIHQNADKNRITQNAIFANSLLGIDLEDDGVTLNDLNDPDKGANQELNFPVITGVLMQGAQAQITGTLNIDTNPTQAVVEIFSLVSPDPSGHGEGDNYLVSATPDALGNWSAIVSGLTLGTHLSATATDINNNTSEFSATFALTNQVNVTISTNPPGFHVTVDGLIFTTPHTFSWLPGSTHQVDAATMITVPGGIRYLFNNWSDGGASTHTITTPTIPTTITASYDTQFYLATSVNPPAFGSIILTPTGPWYNAGSTASLFAQGAPGYILDFWSGSLSGANNPESLLMDGPKNVTANFMVSPLNLISTSPSINAINVSDSTPIEIVFDQAINTATFNNNTVMIYGNFSGYYTGSFVWDAALQQVLIYPDTDFADGELIHVMLCNGIQSVLGVILSPFAFSFTIGATNASAPDFTKSYYYIGESGYSAVADYDADGWIDVATYTLFDSNTKILISIYFNNQGVLQPPVQYIRPVSQYQWPGKIYAADVDRDNDVDIVVVERNAGGQQCIGVMRNNGDGTFANPVFFQAGSTGDLSFADLNNDGYIDIIGNYAGTANVMVFLNGGAGNFNSYTLYAVGDSPIQPFSADFNNDGYNDIAAIIHNPISIAVLLNNGDGTFGSLSTYSVNMGQPQVLKGADFDGDGFIDLACAGDLGYRVNVLLNNGDGTYGTQSQYMLPPDHLPKDLICTDIDGDSDIDILISCHGSSYSGGKIAVLMNMGGGVFDYWGSLTSGSYPTQILFADMDNDGDIDPIVYENSAKRIEIFHNTGNVTEFDFGDAPDPTYPTLIANNGARHVLSSYLYLGSYIDLEPDGQPDALAAGDDNNGVPNDEDGIMFSYPIMPGTQTILQVSYTNYLSNSEIGYLNAWFDFNHDGDWDDANEHVLTDYWLYNGAQTVNIPVNIPAEAKEGLTYARFRLCRLKKLAYYGQAPDGEVEDYAVQIGIASGEWSDGFESYALGSDIVGQGGWQFWGGAASSPNAKVTDEQVFDGSKALKIKGSSAKDITNQPKVKPGFFLNPDKGLKSADNTDDIVQKFNGCNEGVWLFKAYQFIPSDAAGGTTYIIMLNQYDNDGADVNWSSQICFDPDQNLVISEFDNKTLPLVKGSWVKIQHIIDLENDQQHFYYNDLLLTTKSWTNGLSGGGMLNIAALNLYAHTLENTNVNYDELSLKEISYQTLDILNGWSGISSFLNPETSKIEALFSPVSDDIVFLNNFSGIYWPGQSINTLIDWDVTSGYVLKALNDISISFYGDALSNNTVYLESGWNIVPVYSQASSSEMFTGLPGFVIAKGVANTEIYWPAYNINTMPYLNVGKAYFVYTTQAGSITYAKGGEEIPWEAPEMISSTPWNEIVPSPNTHLVAFNAESLKKLQSGDMLAAFTQSGSCAGTTLVSGFENSIALILNGNDPTTLEVEGFSQNEPIALKIYRPSTSEVIDLEVTWDKNLSHSGMFEINGLSAVIDLKISGTAISQPIKQQLSVYPNPTKGNFTIDGLPDECELTILNAHGKEILNKSLVLPCKVDLSAHPKGIYFISIKTEKQVFIEKLIRN